MKITLLATGFSIANVPGIEEQRRIETKAEELERKIREDAERERERQDKQLIEKYYGKEGLKNISTTTSHLEPFVLTFEEMDDDKIIEALEKTAVFKRARDFNPRVQHNEGHVSSSLFD